MTMHDYHYGFTRHCGILRRFTRGAMQRPGQCVQRGEVYRPPGAYVVIAVELVLRDINTAEGYRDNAWGIKLPRGKQSVSVSVSKGPEWLKKIHEMADPDATNMMWLVEAGILSKWEAAAKSEGHAFTDAEERWLQEVWPVLKDPRNDSRLKVPGCVFDHVR